MNLYHNIGVPFFYNMGEHVLYYIDLCLFYNMGAPVSYDMGLPVFII